MASPVVERPTRLLDHRHRQGKCNVGDEIDGVGFGTGVVDELGGDRGDTRLQSGDSARGECLGQDRSQSSVVRLVLASEPALKDVRDGFEFPGTAWDIPTLAGSDSLGSASARTSMLSWCRNRYHDPGRSDIDAVPQ